MVRIVHGLPTALHGLVDVCRGGNGVLIFSPKPSEEIAMNIVRVETGDFDKREHRDLMHAALRAMALPVWIDGYHALRVLIRRVRLLKAEFDRFALTGERLQRIGLVVIDGSPTPGALDMAARLAERCDVAVVVC